MIAVPFFILAALIGVALAAVDSPYPRDRAWIERLTSRRRRQSSRTSQ